MNGQDLMNALSHVEERYLAESERGYMGSRGREFWKAFLGVAACLAVVIAGVMLIPWQFDLPEETQGPGSAWEDTTPCDTALVGAGETVSGDTAPAEEGEYRYVTLLLEEYTEGGFTGMLLKNEDLEQLAAGTIVTVVLEESLLADLESVREQFPVGTEISVRLRDWNLSMFILYADRIEPVK